MSEPKSAIKTAGHGRRAVAVCFFSIGLALTGCIAGAGHPDEFEKPADAGVEATVQSLNSISGGADLGGRGDRSDGQLLFPFDGGLPDLGIDLPGFDGPSFEAPAFEAIEAPAFEAPAFDSTDAPSFESAFGGCPPNVRTGDPCAGASDPICTSGSTRCVCVQASWACL